MQNRPFPCSWNRLSLGCLLLVIAAPAAFAQDASTKSEIIQNKVDEQDVRQHTSAVVAQVQSLIDELLANGISGDDIKVLNATKAALTNLSGPEMERVLASLQKASDATTNVDSEKHVMSAYADQKGIILQFRQILKDYEQRQAAYDLPVKFKELTQRQTDTLQTSIDVARKTAGKSATELTSMEQTTQQIVQADQDAINNEVRLAKEELDKAAKDATDDTAKNIQAAAKEADTGALDQALANADDALKQSQLLKAVAAQQIARDELHKIADDLAPAANAVDALNDAEANLEKIITEQKALMGDTNNAVGVKPRVTGLDQRQGVIVDETNTLSQDTQTLTAAASGMIKDAIQPMQQSRALMGPVATKVDSFTKASSFQQDAITKLEAAEEQLKQDVAAAQKAQDDANKDPVAQLQELQKKLDQAAQEQKQLNQQSQQALAKTPTDPTVKSQIQQAQAQIQQETAALQQTAQPLSLQAAQDLQNAQNQMQQADQNLNNPQQAEQNQQAAQQALQQAQQDVAQQIAQATQTPPDAGQLQQAANDLQAAQTDAANAQADAQQAGQPQQGQQQQGQQQAGQQQAGAQQPGGQTPAGAPPQGGQQAGQTPPGDALAQAQAALAQAAQDTNKAAQTPGLPQQAAQAVQQAQAAIADGQKQAAAKNAQATADDANKAEQALAQAGAAVAIAQAGLAGSAPPDGGQAPGQNGPPQPGDQPGDQPGLASTQPSDQQSKAMPMGANDGGKLNNVDGKGKFVTVASRDRAAIEQTQTEKRPQEFAPMIDQYLQNLSDQSSSSP